MKLIAKIPCDFGKRYYIGDEIPVEAVLDPKAQEKRGVLTIVNDEVGTTPPAVDLGDPAGDRSVMAVIIHAKEGDLPLELTQEGLQAVVDILTSNTEDAEPIVMQMTDGDALIFLDIADSRKTIKNAAKARAQALAAEANDTEEPEDPEESAGDQ